MPRIYETAVASIKVDSCVRCPLSQAKYQKARIGEGFPPRFTSKLVGYYCSKLREIVSGITIHGMCPLPVAAHGEATEGMDGLDSRLRGNDIEGATACARTMGASSERPYESGGKE